MKTTAHSAKEVSALLAQRVPALVEKLGLTGTRKNDEFVAINPTRHDEKQGSFSINLTTGIWSDFATGDKGDALALVAYIETNGDTKAAFKWSLDFLKLASPKPKSRATSAAPVEVTAGLTLDEYAQAKQLDVQFLKTLGLENRADGRGRYLAMPYINRDGEQMATRQRWALEGPSRFKWNSGAKPILYAPDRMAKARELGYVIVTEGESDVHTCLQHGFPAVGLPGAGNWNEARDHALFDGIEKIYVIHEGDAGGDAITEWLSKSSIRHRVFIVELSKPLKDPSALYIDNPTGFADIFRTKLSAAVAWSQIQTDRASEEEKLSLRECSEIANAPDILGMFRDDLKYAGLVGEDRNASILYLALTSRLLPKIVSVAYKGPSSGGKSHAVDRTLAHFPDEAVIRITGMSERALVYMEDDIAHRHIVLAEADGAMGEYQDYLMRTLLSEGRLEYRLAEKTGDGIRERVISKEGPTGLIVTTTRVRLHPENETRLLSLTANDTPQQTRAVLRAIAGRSQPRDDKTKKWQALQTWLGHGEHRVVVPYALRLADLVSDAAVRMRRDFGQVLSLIEAHALLHRATRNRDAEGRIVATMADYATVRDLIFDLVAEGVSATVSPEVREAVEAVRDLAGDTGAGLQAIATRLSLDKSSASRRCAAAKQAGYIVNEETRKGREARYKIGDPMPADKPVLPSVEELEAALSTGGPVAHPLAQHRNGATPRNQPQNDHCSVAVLQKGAKNPPRPTTEFLVSGNGHDFEAEL